MSTPSLSDGQLTPTDTDPDVFFGSCERDEDDAWPTTQDVAEMAIMLYGSAVPFSWNRESLKRLPPGTRPLKLIGEGAANAVFELGVPQGYPWAHEFKGWLLRVAKAPTAGQPARFNYLKQQEFYANEIKAVLKDHVIQQELVVLRHSNIVRQLNDYLRTIDGQRKDKFRGSLVAESNWGLLVEDMRVLDPSQNILFEFKPKWLNQSPSAPSNAIRCRQCAMELYNFLRDPKPSRHLPESKPCPLVLDNPDAPPAISSPFRIAPQLASMSDKAHVVELLNKTVNHQVIRDLRAIQKYTDPNGPLGATKNDPKFRLAMTIRDCTCFVQMYIGSEKRPSDQRLRIRLCDFDLKDTEVKFDRWRSAERDLISSACYTADWIFCNQKYYHPPTRCLLEWSRRLDQPLHVIAMQQKEPTSREKSLLGSLASRVDIFPLSTDPPKIESLLTSYEKSNPKTTVCPFRAEPPFIQPNSASAGQLHSR